MNTETELIELFNETKDLTCPGCGGSSCSYLFEDSKVTCDTIEVVVSDGTIAFAVRAATTQTRGTEGFRFECRNCDVHLHEWDELLNQDFGDLWEVTNRPANVENIICAALEITGTPYHLE